MLAMASRIFLWILSLSISINAVSGDSTQLIIQCIDNTKTTSIQLSCKENEQIFVQDTGIKRAAISNCSAHDINNPIKTNESERCDQDTTQTNKMTYSIREECNTKKDCPYTIQNNCTWQKSHKTYNQTYVDVRYLCVDVTGAQRIIDLKSYWDEKKSFAVVSPDYPKEWMAVEEFSCSVEPITTESIEVSLVILDFSHNGDYSQVTSGNSSECQSYYCVYLGDSFDEAERGGPSWSLPAAKEKKITGNTTLNFRINQAFSNKRFNQTKFYMQLKANRKSSGTELVNIEVKCGTPPNTTTTATTTTTTTSTTTTAATTIVSTASTLSDVTFGGKFVQSNGGGQKSNALDFKPIIGGILGGLLFIVIILIIGICASRRKRRPGEPAKAASTAQDEEDAAYYSTLNDTAVLAPVSSSTPEEEDDIVYEMVKKDVKPHPPPQGAKNPVLSDLTSINRIYSNEGSTVDGPVTSDALYQNTSGPNSPTTSTAPAGYFDNQSRKASNASTVGTGTLTRDLKMVLQQRGILANQERF